MNSQKKKKLISQVPASMGIPIPIYPRQLISTTNRVDIIWVLGSQWKQTLYGYWDIWVSLFFDKLSPRQTESTFRKKNIYIYIYPMYPRQPMEAATAVFPFSHDKCSFYHIENLHLSKFLLPWANKKKNRQINV